MDSRLRRNDDISRGNDNDSAWRKTNGFLLPT
jgi:hypothetical protein